MRYCSVMLRELQSNRQDKRSFCVYCQSEWIIPSRLLVLYWTRLSFNESKFVLKKRSFEKNCKKTWQYPELKRCPLWHDKFAKYMKTWQHPEHKRCPDDMTTNFASFFQSCRDRNMLWIANKLRLRESKKLERNLIETHALCFLYYNVNNKLQTIKPLFISFKTWFSILTYIMFYKPNTISFRLLATYLLGFFLCVCSKYVIYKLINHADDAIDDDQESSPWFT